jgi:hypothetical protein
MTAKRLRVKRVASGFAQMIVSVNYLQNFGSSLLDALHVNRSTVKMTVASKPKA